MTCVFVNTANIDESLCVWIGAFGAGFGHRNKTVRHSLHRSLRFTYCPCSYDSSANTLLQVRSSPRARLAITPSLTMPRFQMHVCMEMADIFEAQGSVDDAFVHRGNAVRHLQTSVLGADCMFVALAHAKNGKMLHKVPFVLYANYLSFGIIELRRFRRGESTRLSGSTPWRSGFSWRR